MTSSMGLKIKVRREENGWSRRKLAEMLHISPMRIRQWEECGSDCRDGYLINHLIRLGLLDDEDYDTFLYSTHRNHEDKNWADILDSSVAIAIVDERRKEATQ